MTNLEGLRKMLLEIEASLSKMERERSIGILPEEEFARRIKNLLELKEKIKQEISG